MCRRSSPNPGLVDLVRAGVVTLCEDLTGGDRG
jgi:hypothetical protein